MPELRFRLKPAVLILVAVVAVVAFIVAATTSNNSTDHSSAVISSSLSAHGVASGSAFLVGVKYSQLREAVINMYHASDPETTDIETEFDEALTAMRLIETDGLPVPIDGIDGLYVGSVGAAYNLEGLQKEGITHILSLERAAPCKWPDLFNCLHIDEIWDTEEYSDRIGQYFNQTLPFIDNALTHGGRILVHCWAGHSRSVATIEAYMIKYLEYTPKEAIRQIRKTREDAGPNKSYRQELWDFYYKLYPDD